MAPGRAWPAAHPQIELTMTRTVPDAGSERRVHLLGSGQGFDADGSELLPHGRDGFGVVDRRQRRSGVHATIIARYRLPFGLRVDPPLSEAGGPIFTDMNDRLQPIF